MEREILFRGKRTDNGEWVTGTPFIFEDRCKMIQAVAVHPDFVDEGNVYYSEGFSVDHETVGQYTGLTDKNGKRIFEGDIIKDDWGKIFKVIFTTTSCGFMVKCTVAPNEYEKGKYRLGDAWCNTIAVVGNIHDNPELLNGTES